MTDDEVMSVLLDVFDEIKDDPVDTEAITPETTLRDDLQVDSLQTAEMLVEIELRLGVVIEDEEAPKLRTVADVIKLIQSKGPEPQEGV
jgi:acyl carrier protein